MRTPPLVRLLAVLALLPVIARAQNPVVSGRVVDSSDAVVPNTRVELTNRDTGVMNATTTNAEGLFVLPPVPPGLYDISAAATGFKAARVDGFRLEIGQARTINLQLQPGEVRESVTVTDTAPLITTSRPDRGTVVENKSLLSIPLNIRNPYLLLANVARRHHRAPGRG